MVMAMRYRSKVEVHFVVLHIALLLILRKSLSYGAGHILSISCHS